ncbi:hypothetical protein [Leptospira idonii]|uniref:Uncharacterized protein n=1 Tax=Leptospira idonii TaxID=1193500 RepID=A0A4R9LX10_9LEPT|nr:hypothetical protein [Leptospira idonii]TGN17908.1 hypothetical protein EHS15_15930 [Leptospira idonii]
MHNLQILNDYINIFGENKLVELLTEKIKENEGEILTIIANKTHHFTPTEYLHGDIFIASEGNLDFSSKDSIILTYKTILKGVLNKLKEKSWKKIYLIPSGHSTLSLQIKALVYHTVRLETIDLFYSKGIYHEIDIYYRDI